MKHFLSVLIAVVFASLNAYAIENPCLVRVSGQSAHVQGVAYDAEKGRFYFSFTTKFLVTDSKGTILGSVEKIHGHLGAMTFDPQSRKVYASLECKNDVIGSNISKALCEKGFEKSSFYVAEIDVDNISGINVEESGVFRRIDILPANEDYEAEVECGGEKLQHRFACSGIDGVTIGPAFGKPDGKERYLYVAYGIYGDTARTDNDYQVILRYPLGRWNTAPERYFIKTGNTNWGVQNLAWDSSSGLMLMAVYKGKKTQYPNYSLFAVDMVSKPVSAGLEGVPYYEQRVLTLPLAGKGWDFKFGATGMCPVGDGLWYMAESFEETSEDGIKTYGADTRLYKWTGGADEPFCTVDENHPLNKMYDSAVYLLEKQ